MFTDDHALAEAVRGMAQRVVEFSAFARDVLGLAEPAATATATATATAGGPAAKVALHNYCSARREMSTHQPSAALLRALPGVEVA